MLEIEEIGGGALAFARIEDEWRTLQTRALRVTPFATWEWNRAWHRTLARDAELRLLIFRNTPSGETVGIAPLCVLNLHGLPVRQLTWTGYGVSDYHEPLALPEYADAVTDGLFRYLDEVATDWDIADLAQIHQESPLAERTPRPYPHRPADAQSVFPTEPCPYVPLPTTWDDYTATLGKKMRSNLGYYDRLLYRTFPDAKIFLVDETNLDEGLTALFRLHQARWNARLLPGALGNRKVQTFHREAAAGLLACGALRLHLLSADGDIRAALYCFATGNRTFYYLGGFAPEFGKYSLGTVLTAHAIKFAMSEKHIEFDFLRGAEEYKTRWTPHSRLNCRLLLRSGASGIGRVARGHAGFAIHKLEREITVKAKAFAETQGRKR